MAVVDINALAAAQGIDENDSKKWMGYTSDTGVVYAVKISENIGETMGFIDITEANETTPEKPASLTMRVVNAVSANGKVKVRYPCGSPTAPIYVEGGTIEVPRKGNSSGLICSVTGVTGEKRRIVSYQDSGQDGGDLT